LLLLSPRGLAPARAADQPAPAPAPAPAAAPAETEAKQVTIQHADHLRKEGAMYHLTGSVVLLQGDVTMTMDQCDYDDSKNTAVATGHLKIVDPESTVTGDKLQADFTKKLAQIIGNVTIVTQRKKTAPATEPETAPEKTAEKPAAGEKQPSTTSQYREKKTTITCPQIDYYYAADKKQATVTGPVKAVQEDKTVTADKAYYDGVKDVVTLDGNVTVTTDKGDEFRCPEATISLKDDWVEAPNVNGVVTQPEKSSGEAPPATPSAAPAPAAPPPAAAPAKP
jgi:lipopolysaccharide assembly outer membrane protein LptD (OstA)